MKKKVAFFNNNLSRFQTKPGTAIEHVFGQGRREQIQEIAEVYPHVINANNFAEHAEALGEIEAVFSTWGMPTLEEEQIDQLKSLKAVFYAAGATPFRKPYVERGVTVCSATRANALPVAEFVLMQIMLCATNFLRHIDGCKSREDMDQQWCNKGRGAYGAKVSLLGKGSIAKHLLELLEKFNFDVQVIGSREIMQDPDRLKSIFKESFIVSNHLPNREDNQKILNAELFELMPEGANFINTGRGAQVDEAGLARVFTERPDLTAYLDVQHPEPPEADSPLYTAPNIHLTLHIAGAIADEVLRLADYMIDDFG